MPIQIFTEIIENENDEKNIINYLNMLFSFIDNINISNKDVFIFFYRFKILLFVI